MLWSDAGSERVVPRLQGVPEHGRVRSLRRHMVRAGLLDLSRAREEAGNAREPMSMSHEEKNAWCMGALFGVTVGLCAGLVLGGMGRDNYWEKNLRKPGYVKAVVERLEAEDRERAAQKGGDQ